MDETKSGAAPGTDFIRQIVAADLASGRQREIVTRFPPEPNGYMHIGHAKSVCLNFGIAEEFGGRCHLRFDDTNPETEDERFVAQFQEDIRWLGFDWGEHLYFASDYFERMYGCAEVLIGKGLAYVDSQSGEQIREGRGTVTEPGVEGPFRNRSTGESLDLFRRMRAGEFDDGTHVLRARIDMALPNMLMRDPVLYRIRHAHHYRQGDEWCIYPLYDYAHCLEDAFEGVTHSICTLEFENNRELYDWVLDGVGFEEPRPHQYEFARLALEHAVLSKRRIIPLVEQGVVPGWDDPRLSTVAGLRRRGVPPEAIRLFCDIIGVSRANATVEVGKLDFAIREVLNRSAPRVMAVLDPLRVVITNFPENRVELLDAPYFPHDVPLEGSRPVPFTRELLIERSDFEADPPKGFRRLTPGGEVRLRYAYVIRCDEVVRGDDGRVVELCCSYDPETRGGASPMGRKVPGTIHWVSAPQGLRAEVRLYGPLFLDAEPQGVGTDADLTDFLNPASLVLMKHAVVEPSVVSQAPDARYQFERTGYFWRDPEEGRGEHLVFNRIVPLKDTWGRREAGTPHDAASAPDLGADATRRRAAAAEVTRTRVSARRASQRESDAVLAARFARYRDELGLAVEQADLLTETRSVSDFFEEALAAHADAAGVAAWIVVDLRGLRGERPLESLPFDGKDLGRLAALVDGGAVSRRAAKDVLTRMVESGGDPAALVEAMGLTRIEDASALSAVVEAALARWPEKVEEYRAGRKNLLGLFVGEVMKASGGAADPKSVRALLEARLEG